MPNEEDTAMDSFLLLCRAGFYSTKAPFGGTIQASPTDDFLIANYAFLDYSWTTRGNNTVLSNIFGVFLFWKMLLCICRISLFLGAVVRAACGNNFFGNKIGSKTFYAELPVFLIQTLCRIPGTIFQASSFSRFSSISRRITSDKEMPKILARALSHLRPGSVKVMDWRRRFMGLNMAPQLGGVNAH